MAMAAAIRRAERTRRRWAARIFFRPRRCRRRLDVGHERWLQVRAALLDEVLAFRQRPAWRQQPVGGPALVLPEPCVGRDALAGAQELPVLVDPAAQPLPAADQRLVRHLHGLAAGRGVPLGDHQAGVGQLADRGLGHRIGLRHGGALARILHPLAGPHHADQQPLRRLPFGLGEPVLEHLFGAMGDGARNAAELVVRIVLQEGAVPFLP
jgi:hypothetical protein